MTALPGYLDLFISPITGKLSGIGSLPSLPENYILLGDQNNTAQPSLVFQDLRLDFIRLKENLYESAPILQTAAKPFANGQALDQLTPGLMKQTDGVVATAIPNVDYATEERLQELVDEAEGYKDEAQQSASDAATSATNASNSASDAAGSARAASLSSTTASLSATEAGAAAATATTSAGTAVTAAATASGFSVAAATSAGIASTASETARGYSDTAQGYSNDAEAFATNSQNSATDSYNYLQELLTTGFTFTGDVTGSGVLSSPIPLSLALTLNQIKSPTAPIDVDDFKIVNLADPENPTDAVNYRTLMSYVGGTENLTLIGDGTASGSLSSPITFTLTKTLNNITNAGDLSLASYKITNLALPVLPTDGVNMLYVDNHTWTSSDITDFSSAVTAFSLDQFLPPQTNLSMNNLYLRDVLDPERPQDAATMNYVDNHTWLSSSITDLATTVQGYSLSSFAPPTNNLSMNNFILRDVVDPVRPQDAATMNYVDNHTWLSASITDLASTVQAYPLNSFAPPTNNVSMYNFIIRDVADPVLPTDGANMEFVETYVDTQISAIPVSRYLTSTTDTNPFTFSNTCVPTDVAAVSNSESFINIYGGGYAFVHQNYSGDPTQIGEFQFDIINLDSSYTNLIKFTQSAGVPEIIFYATTLFEGGLVDFSGTSIYVNNPTDGAQAASKAYVDNKTWLSSSITDLYAYITSIPLNDLLQPADVIDMNYQRIADVRDPLYGTDAANMRYVNTQISNIPQSRYLTSTIPGNAFTFSNTCIPTYSEAVSNSESFINVYGGGYAFIHANYSTDTTQIGEFDFVIVNTDSSYTNLMTFSQSGGIPEIIVYATTIFEGGLVDFTGTSIYVNNPTDGGQAASKAYVDTSTRYGLRPSGCMYLDGDANVTTSANTWTKLTGATLSSELNLFSMSTYNQLTYIGTQSIVANISGSICMAISSSGTNQLWASIYKNGVIWTPSINSGLVSTSDFPLILPLNAQIPLAPNDYIEVWYQSSVATIITASFMSITINPV